MTNRPFADAGELVESLNRIRDAQGAYGRTEQDHHEQAMSAIARVEDQTRRTNGRVTKIESIITAGKAVVAVLILEAGWAVAVLTGLIHR